MTQEFETLYANHTWKLVKLPARKKAIGCKYVYKIKHKADGSVERYKARLVVKGYTQESRIDYAETFSPVEKMSTVRALISTVVKKEWDLYQLDMNNVSKQWYDKMTEYLHFRGFRHSTNDYSLFYKKQGESSVFVAVYVDDVILTGTNLEEIKVSEEGPTLGIFLSNDPSYKVIAYCDLDWAACPNSRRSVSGYLVLFRGCPISWKSKKQTTVSLSSAEAECRSLRKEVGELVWVHRLLEELTVSCTDPIQVFCDSQAAVHIARNPVCYERTKHIEVDCHFVQDKLHDGLIMLHHISTHDQIADILTKALTGISIQIFYTS
uniref:Uncharacterized protein LOC104225681 n=1 Tax=Nicotiana sylvestris TaxID=4096 RepID=A0A1U7WME2_NICSY|nr:PREDICTED: uncharacterized protein LOC104225681 [Nicotiana sylvestris]